MASLKLSTSNSHMSQMLDGPSWSSPSASPSPPPPLPPPVAARWARTEQASNETCPHCRGRLASLPTRTTSLSSYSCKADILVKYHVSSESFTHKEAIEWCQKRSLKILSIEGNNLQDRDNILEFIKSLDFWLWEPDPKELHHYEGKKSFFWVEGEKAKLCHKVSTKGVNLKLYSSYEGCEETFPVLCEDNNNDNFTKSASVKESCYYFSWEKLSYFEAVQFCKRIGMLLLSIQDPAKYTVVNRALFFSGRAYDEYESRQYFWTSGNNFAEGGETYQWLSGEPVLYNNWEKKENTNEYSCISIRPDLTNPEWINNIPCDNELFFICEPPVERSLHGVLPKKYYISTKQATYFRAHGLCELQGMKLLSIEDKDKFISLNCEMPKGEDQYWTSGSRVLPNSLTYVWYGSTVVRYKNFRKGQDTATERGCISIEYDGQILMYITRCERELRFICEQHFPRVNMFCTRH